MCATVLLLATATAAQASKLRLLAPGVTSFASDGTRYVAWEGRPTGAIFVLDTRSGQRRTIHARCALEDRAPASSGRFLLQCSASTAIEESALLDVRTDRITVLPTASYREDGLHGTVWQGVGRHYVIGGTGVHARCGRPRRHEDCLALFDISTGVVSEVPESRVPDVDRVGAPPLCSALREKVRHLSQGELVSDYGPLIALGSYFSYREGLLARPEGLLKREIPDFVKHLIVDRCHGPSMLVPAHAERREPNGGWHPELSGGTLTWDTAPNNIWAVNLWEQQEEARASRRQAGPPGTLVSYNLHTHATNTWALPVLKLRLTVEFFRPLIHQVSGTFGYSAHTDREVFWIATRSLSCQAAGSSSGGLDEEHCDGEPGHVVSSVYTARQ